MGQDIRIQSLSRALRAALFFPVLASCSGKPDSSPPSGAASWVWRTPPQDAILWDVDYSPDGTRIVTAGYDKTARVWDAETGREVFILRGHSQALDCAHFSPDGKHVLTAAMDDETRLWDAKNGRPWFVVDGTHADFSADGQRIFSIVYRNGGSPCFVWDTRTGRELPYPDELISPFYGDEARVDNGPKDAERFVTQDQDSRLLRVWNSLARRVLATLDHSPYGRILLQCAVISKDGSLVATQVNGAVRIWDVNAERLLQTLGAEGIIWKGFSALDSRIATLFGAGTSRQSEVAVWNARTGEEMIVLRGHSDRVTALAWSPCVQKIATSSMDRTATIWHVPTKK